jgi:transposase
MTVLVMNVRQQKGMALAKGRTIRRQGNLWLVPSQTGDGTLYAVDLANQKCTCLDFKENQEKCKHIFAAEFASARVQNAVTPMIQQNAMATRPTYPQNWVAYNAAQETEKDTFQELLHELCGFLPVPSPSRGRPPYPLRDALFWITYKVYSRMTARGVMCDLEEAHRRGFIEKVPHRNTILNVLADDNNYEVLRALIERSALPLSERETHFASDSTKFSPSRKAHWADSKTGKEGLQQDWVKCHMMVGVDSHIVTAIEIREQNASDAKTFKALFDTTSKNFDIVAISADKGYCSQENYDIVGRNGATPYIAFLSHVKATTGNKYWKESFNRFKSNPQEYKDGYHQRSNAESAFSAIKRKYGNSLRTRKSEAAMKNEILCKILCHNIVVLIHEMHKGHVHRPFWGKREPYEN